MSSTFLKFFVFFQISFSLSFPPSQECLSIISQARRFVNTFFEKISLFSSTFLTFRLSRRVLDYYITYFFFCQPFFPFFCFLVLLLVFFTFLFCYCLFCTPNRQLYTIFPLKLEKIKAYECSYGVSIIRVNTAIYFAGFCSLLLSSDNSVITFIKLSASLNF